MALVGLTVSAIFVWALTDSREAYATNPFNVTLTGVILPAESQTDVNTYTLQSKDQKWLFRVSDVEIRSSYSPNLSGWAILNIMGPQKIRLMGKENLVEPMNNPNLTCRSLSIQGSLYVSIGALYLSSVEELPPDDKDLGCG